MKKIFTFYLFLVIVKLYSQVITLDTSFGNAGFTLIPDTSEINCFDFDTSGNIISTGYAIAPGGGSIYHLTTVKTNSDGILDSSFGTNGIIKTAIAYSEMPYAIKILPDGRILICGSAYLGPTPSGPGGYIGFAIRYDKDGKIDESFATNGIFRLSTVSHFLSIINLADDSIILAGNNNLGGILAKLDKNGDLNTQFGNNGVLSLSENNFRFAIEEAKILSDNKILCVGSDYSENENPKIAFSKVDEYGSFDSTFGQNGKMILDFYDNKESEVVYEYALHSKETNDNKIIINSIVGNEGVLLKINQNGTLDSTFGSNGIVGDFYPINRRIELQPDGKILRGVNKEISDYNVGYSLARVLTNGTADNNFNNNTGFFDIDISPKHDYIQDMKLQGTEKLIIAGSGKNSNLVTNFALTRVNLNSNLSTNDLKERNPISVYPNPSNGKFNIKSSNKITTIKIFDSSGKNIINLNNPKINFDISYLNDGIYFLEIIDINNDKLYEKIIIKNN